MKELGFEPQLAGLLSCFSELVCFTSRRLLKLNLLLLMITLLCALVMLRILEVVFLYIVCLPMKQRIKWSRSRLFDPWQMQGKTSKNPFLSPQISISPFHTPGSISWIQPLKYGPPGSSPSTSPPTWCPFKPSPICSLPWETDFWGPNLPASPFTLASHWVGLLQGIIRMGEDLPASHWGSYLTWPWRNLSFPSPFGPGRLMGYHSCWSWMHPIPPWFPQSCPCLHN